MKQPNTWFAVLLIVLWAIPVCAEPDNKIVIAVSDFEGRGLAEGEAVTLTDAFRSYLIETEVFRLMERGRMDEILKEQGFQSSGACSDQACIVEMGQLLGVNNIVTGSIGKVGETYSVNVRFISVATGEIKKSVKQFFKGKIDGLLTEVLPKIATDLAQAATGGKAPAAAVAPAPAPVAADATAQTPAGASAQKEASVDQGKKEGSNTMLWIGLGVLAAGGAAAAYFLILNNPEEDKPAAAAAGDGQVRVTWD